MIPDQHRTRPQGRSALDGAVVRTGTGRVDEQGAHGAEGDLIVAVRERGGLLYLGWIRGGERYERLATPADYLFASPALAERLRRCVAFNRLSGRRQRP